MFSLGGQEFLIIVVVALLLFGPDKIPQLARTIGRFTREFNKYKSIMESTISQELYRAEGPTKDSMTVEERIEKAAASAVVPTARASADAPDAETENGTVTARKNQPASILRADEADEEDVE